MSVVANHLTIGNTGADASSYSTASITPSAEKLILATAGGWYNSGAIPTVSISGCNLTWTLIATKVSADGKQRLSMFRATGSPTTGQLTIAWGGTIHSCVWVVDEFSSTSLGGTNASEAIVQSATASHESETNTGLTVTLAAFSSTDNATYGAVRVNADAHSISPGSGFTELAENSTNDAAIQSEFKDTNDTTVDWTWGSNIDRNQGIAVEIKFQTLARTTNVSDAVAVSEGLSVGVDSFINSSESVSVADTPRVCLVSDAHLEETVSSSEFVDSRISNARELNISIWKDTVKVTPIVEFPGLRDAIIFDDTHVSEKVTIKVLSNLNYGIKPSFDTYK